MALTLEAEQRLEAAELIDFFTADEARWKEVAQKTYDFVEDTFPAGATIRRDDVSNALTPILAVDEALVNKLAADKLKGKFWVSFFADLIIDRVWDQIS
ncbi:hypothetical protein [Ideonella sp. YS5]|uniref:hypothetical protein n=1 Tax=Ideonella sp. YS5 TaxID=3453714 RepID=UPI003EEC58A6